jgi:benzodiazapine receptor
MSTTVRSPDAEPRPCSGSRQQTIALILAVLACLIAMAVGAAATAPNIDGWYASLTRPSWTPPSWVFGPVWTVLYLMMAVSVWLVWRRRETDVRRPLVLFAVQLTLNVGWSWLFFSLHAPLAAMIEIVVLWIAIAATIASFWRYSRTAAILLIPYLVWVTYATTLNFGFWQLNIQP